LCGLGHFNMRAFLEVKSQEDFDQWLKQQSQ
jgi:heme/copper-type cytochrome/quinol oxidase subunit 2